jgi:hypothetical protein
MAAGILPPLDPEITKRGPRTLTYGRYVVRTEHLGSVSVVDRIVAAWYMRDDTPPSIAAAGFRHAG